MKKFLKRNKNIKITPKTRRKIEKIHLLNIEEVLYMMRNPGNLVVVEQQPSRRAHDETYMLCFQKNKRKILIVVITYKRLKKKIYLVTAFGSTKKLTKLVKKPRIVRS